MVLAAGAVVVAVIFSAVFHFNSLGYRLRKIPESDLFSMGQVAAAHNDCPHAVEIYQTLLSKDPRHAIAMDYMIDCQVRMKDWRHASEWSEKLIRLAPAQPAYRYRLALIYQQLGQGDLAKQMQASATASPTPSKKSSQR